MTLLVVSVADCGTTATVAIGPVAAAPTGSEKGVGSHLWIPENRKVSQNNLLKKRGARIEAERSMAQVLQCVLETSLLTE